MAVLRAEVDLRYVGEVISAIKAGNSGYAYVVTRSGELIAHPDISLVLQRTRLADLDQVKSAFQSTQGARRPKPLVALNLQGQKVFSSSAAIPGLEWAVIVERPVSEAYESLYASLLRTSGLLLVGLGVALWPASMSHGGSCARYERCAWGAANRGGGPGLSAGGEDGR